MLYSRSLRGFCTLILLIMFAAMNLNTGQVEAQYTLDGLKVREIYNGPDNTNIFGFDWSPDSKHIVFALYKDQESHLMLMNEARTQVRSLFDQDATWPEWSPDGKTILFRSRLEDSWGLFLFDVESETIRQLPDETAYGGFWSPDGKQIFLATREGISVMDADGTNATLLLEGYEPAQIDVSPDGKQIVFDEIDDGGGAIIYRMNVDGSGLEAITEPGISFDPIWSPNGDYIVFIAPNEDDPNFRWSLFRMNPDGSEKTLLMANGESNEDPVWSPDGTSILFRTGERTLSILEMDKSDSPAALPTATP
jgi:TolB protein